LEIANLPGYNMILFDDNFFELELQFVFTDEIIFGFLVVLTLYFAKFVQQSVVQWKKFFLK
jgi:hypothetical protein